MTNQDVFEHAKLTILQKQFLLEVLESGRQVEIIEYTSELLACRDKKWVQQVTDAGYYLEVGYGFTCGIALVLKDLIEDVPLWTKDEDDQYQRLDLKGAFEELDEEAA